MGRIFWFYMQLEKRQSKWHVSVRTAVGKTYYKYNSLQELVEPEENADSCKHLTMEGLWKELNHRNEQTRIWWGTRSVGYCELSGLDRRKAETVKTLRKFYQNLPYGVNKALVGSNPSQLVGKDFIMGQK